MENIFQILISHFLDRSIMLYHSASEDISNISDEEEHEVNGSKEHIDWGILGIEELFSSYIAGYAQRFIKQGYKGLCHGVDALQELKLLSIVRSKEFQDWFFRVGFKHEKFLEYIFLIELIRIILIESLEIHDSEKIEKE